MATQIDFDVEVSDVEYQRVADTPLLARVYRPLGRGPFPTILDVHGGAWTRGDRNNNSFIDSTLARQGILTVAIDFRQPPDAGYPASISDTNLGIRWLKVHAVEFGGKAELGALGTSSGGHMVLLSALRPHDPRYSELSLPDHPEVDASLAYVVAGWPVSDPLYRYQLARRTGNDKIVQGHDAYWGTEAAMAEGNPVLTLERGEAVELPPALVLQRTRDANHPLEMQERLVEQYLRRGGHIEMSLYEHLPASLAEHPDAPDTVRAMHVVADFIRRHG